MRVSTGHTNVDIESDSLVLVQLVSKKVIVPWTISYEMKQIWSLLLQLKFSINHVFHESNMVADHLANLGLRARKEVFFDRWENLPKHLRGLVRLDRCGLFNLRCKNY